MIPEKGKVYNIDYQDPNDSEDFYYVGKATFTGERIECEGEPILYIFTMPDNAFTAMFRVEDITGESE